MLCTYENDTYLSLSGEHPLFKGIIQIKGRNEIVGSLGRCFDDLLIKKSLRKCRVLGQWEFGERLSNGSFTGVLGLFQSKQVDLYLQSQSEYVDQPWLAKSNPTIMDSLIFGHPIQSQRSSFSYFNLLDNFKFGFIRMAVYLLSAFGILTLCFLLNEISHRVRFERRNMREISKRIASAMNSFRVNRLSAIGLFILFVQLFIWLNQLFLINNIKVVDTSNLVKDVLSTSKTACLFRDSQFFSMIASSPIRSIVGRLYEKTRLRPDIVNDDREALGSSRCLISRDPFQITNLIKLNDIFFIGEKKFADFGFASSSSIEGLVNKLWISKKPVYEYNHVLYHSPDKPAIAKTIQRYAEHGLWVRLDECTCKIGRTARDKSKITLFETIDQSIFKYYALFCTLVFVAFCLHHLIKFTWKRTVLLRYSLRDRIARFASSLSRFTRSLVNRRIFLKLFHSFAPSTC